MANPAKKRGTEHESQCVRWLKRHGWGFARRITQKGAKDEGDIVLGDGVPIMVEAKNEKTITLALYAKEMEAQIENALAETGVVIIKRRGTTDVGQYYALTTVNHWNRLALAVYKVRQRKKRVIRSERPIAAEDK